MTFDPAKFDIKDVMKLDDPALQHIEPKIRHMAVPVEVLVPDPANVRLHPDPNLAGIRASMSRYRQRVLLVVNARDMVVEKGNGTLSVALALEWRYVAVLWVDDDPATATGFAIADNRTSETATWDLAGLYRQLEALKWDIPAIDDEFHAELEVLVTGGEFTPLPEVPDGDAGDPNEAVQVKIVLENQEALKPCAVAIKAVLDQHPDWKGKIIAAGPASKQDAQRPEANP